METCYIRLYMKGIEKPFIFEVSEAEQNKFRNHLDGVGFFVFETVNGFFVAVNLEGVQAFNLLWEPALISASAPGKADDRWPDAEIAVFLRNRERPYATNASEPKEIYVVLETLTEGFVDDGEDLFVGFQDEDGEEVYFNTQQTLLIRVSALVYRQGEALIGDEGEDDDDDDDDDEDLF